jgi:hypothetical protein
MLTNGVVLNGVARILKALKLGEIRSRTARGMSKIARTLRKSATFSRYRLRAASMMSSALIGDRCEPLPSTIHSFLPATD